MARDSARRVASRVLRQIFSEKAFATPALDAALDSSGMPARERRLATELVYGVCRYRSRLDRALASATNRGLGKVNPAMLTILRIAAYELLFLDRIPDRASVDQAARAARRLGGQRMAGFANGVLRRLARDGEPALPDRGREPERYAEIAYALPSWLRTRLSASFADRPDDMVAAARAFASRAPLTIRVNRRRTSPSELAETLGAERPGCEVESTPHCPDALRVTGLGSPERSPSHAAGLWTVQDLGAQLVGRLLAPPTGDDREKIALLDLCAGVGGKTTHLGEIFGDRAEIDAVDISAAKLAHLERAAARLGLSNIRAHAADAAALGDPEVGDRLGLKRRYDAVLLDAPCTGLGVLRRHPEAKWRIQPEDVPRMAAVQKTLLEAAAARVAENGVLLYSVCTFTDEEGPAQIADFLARHPDYRVAPPGLAAGDAGSELLATGILQTWPHLHDADAFYAARLVRG